MFETIIGNDKIKQDLERTIQQNTISHSYLFVGVDGIGKKKLAKEMAMKILCLKKNTINCDCKSCLEFEGNNHPDFLCLEPEENIIKIDQIRMIQKRIQEKPIISTRKIMIIDEADKMTKEAQNCLLKTLEEPPSYMVIVLIGSNENAFLTTIQSRCMILPFQVLEKEEIKQYLKQNNIVTDWKEEQFDIFQGSIGKAIALKDKQEEYEKIQGMIEQLNTKDFLFILSLAEPIYQKKEEIFELLEFINILLLKKAKKEYQFTGCIKIVENTKKRLKQNANYDMCIDNMVFNMWEEVN